MEDTSAAVLSRKELRKQKLMKYLAAKGKLKPPTVGSSLQQDCRSLKPLSSSVQGVTEKENKVPADKNQSKGFKGPNLTAQSSQDPLRRPFGVSGNLNVKRSTLNRNELYSSSSSASTQLKRIQNAVLTKTYTAVSSKSSATSAVTLKKQTNTRSQTSGKAPSNAAWIAGTKSNSISKCSSSSVASCRLNTAAGRISLGPLVLTKTGLTPAVPQPRNTKSDVSHSHKTITTATVAAKKVQPSTASVSQWFSNSRARGDIQAQNKSKPKPPLNKNIQPTCKSQISAGLRATSASFKCKAPVINPGGKMLTSKSAGQPLPAVRYKKQTSVAEVVTKSQLFRAAPQTSSKTSGFKPAVVTKLGGKAKTSIDTNHKTEKSSAKVPPPQMASRLTVGPAMSRTVPQPARSVSMAGRATDTKTLKVTAKSVPQTEGKKGSTAQEERLRKLQEWREAKGISYKRPSRPVKPAVPRAASVVLPVCGSMKTKDEAQSLIAAVDRTLADCIKLLAEGCPPAQVTEILTRLPAVSQKFAKYWICQVRLMEQEGHLDVLPMFEEAVRVVLEPIDELRTVVFDILRKKDKIPENEKQINHPPPDENPPEGSSDPLMTPKPVRMLINGERGDSSVIKYKITRTPGCPNLQREPVQFNGQEVRFFTPVRRSVRIERVSLRYPPSLQDHDVCVSSFSDLIAEEDGDGSKEQKEDESRPTVRDDLMYVYKENEALGDKVSVHLVCEDGV